ncbi:MAG: outer membrane beta-barrel protein [Nitrospira sp.]
MILVRCYRYAERSGTVRGALALILILGYSALQIAEVHAETTIVPSASVAGRYDTNIFNRPALILPAGTKLEDFVTTVGGAAQILHDTRDIEAKIKIGGDFNTYVENTNLNFFNATLNGYVSLDRWVDQYVRGAKLRVIENFRYTPESPGFVTGVRQIVPQDPTFFQGVQGFRANTFINTTSVNGSYPVSRDLAVEGGYTFALRRVGTIAGGDTPGVSFFDTNSHTWYGGPRYRLTRNDSIAAVYRQSYILQSRSDGGRSFSTTLVTLAGDYTKEFQEWNVTVEGGVTFVEPAGRSLPSGSITVTTQPERDTVLNVTLSREARPSIFLQGGAVISNLARAGISHRIYERLTLDGSAAYGFSQFFPDTSNSTFQNFTGSAGLSYKVTRNITGDISYRFTNIKSDGSAVEYQFSRHVFGFFLTAEWK